MRKANTTVKDKDRQTDNLTLNKNEFWEENLIIILIHKLTDSKTD